MRNLNNKIKRFVAICYVLGCLFCITGCQDIKNQELQKKNNNSNNETKIESFSKSTMLDKDNGWVYYLEAKKDENKIKYIFTGDNIKYLNLEGYTMDTLDENNNVIDSQLATQPSLIHNKETNKDVESITNFLNEKQFNQKIT